MATGLENASVNGNGGFSIVGRERVAQFGFLDAELLSVEAPDGRLVERIVVRHPGAVAVVALVDRDVILIEQYRAALDRWLLEVPAGKLDKPGESTESAAGRELAEEVGRAPVSLERVCTFYTTPGFSDESIAVYLARESEAVERAPAGVEEEAARVVQIPFDEALDLIASGRIADAKTIIALREVARLIASR